MAQKTALAAEHERAGGKMVDFAGWWLPVEFSGLRQEHTNVRENVGLFDVSHMGEFRVKGPQAVATLQWLLTNDVESLESGQAQYTLLPNEQGGLVDDLIVYCLEKGQDYLLCVNAANIPSDFEWIQAHNQGAEVTDESAQWSQVAVQGPKAMELINRVFKTDVEGTIPSFQFRSQLYEGASLVVARTGYTGEDGVEIFLPNDKAETLWQDLLNQGRDLGVQPIGLGARDTLRTEACLPLYGHEIDATTNPYAARLGWVVKADKKDFVGKAKILEEKEAGLKEKRVGFQMKERGIPRQGYKVFSFDNEEIGRVTSGTPSPTLQENIGLAYVAAPYAEVGKEIWIEVRRRRVKAEIVKTPFYKRPKE